MRIAINGFGRIGRSVLRAAFAHPRCAEFEIVAINELARPEAIRHLLQYDSSHGRFGQNVQLQDGHLLIGDKRIALLHQADPADLPWRALNIDLVLDCSGAFHQRDELMRHCHAGAGKVLLSHPGAQDLDLTVIYGVNEQLLQPEHRIVSNGSCTTNCVVPVIDILDQHFGIESGAITTIHAAMHDQKVIDAYHDDLRRARAASHSIIPVDTKLALGIERILPKFTGRFEAIAVRVPTINVTAMDVSLTALHDVSSSEVNAVLHSAAQGALQGLLGYTEEPLVSVDFNLDPRSVVVDGSMTRVSHKRLIKTLLWCDNEWGFANRMLDTGLVMFDH